MPAKTNQTPHLFLPTAKSEMAALGWQALDIIFVTGDTYIDSPYIGVALLGRLLVAHGYRVGIIAQPDIQSGRDIGRLGEPLLFWGVSGGSVDSMVANYTPLKKRRKSDDYTPGGLNTRRPDRALLVYANLIREHFKQTAPIVLGGIEASLRRLAHYDFWSGRIRKSVLFDAKADILVYGMAEKTVLALAEALRQGTSFQDIPGLCYAAKEPKADCLELPSYDEVVASNDLLIRMFELFYQNNEALSARGLCQQQDNRYLVMNPPAPPLSSAELDAVYELPFLRQVHPYYQKDGLVKALDTIQFSLTSHRGCYGECNFCAIAVHQGRTVSWRSPASLIREAESFTSHADFRGVITDVGGPTANMYGFECPKKLRSGPCHNKRCLYPSICKKLPIDHQPQTKLLKQLKTIPGVRHVFVASGIRHDMVIADRQHGNNYLKELVANHVSGQLKLAPEHVSAEVLNLMGKPGPESLLKFRELFSSYTGACGKKQFLTYYFIAAYPGCTKEHMREAKSFADRQLKIRPEQVQIFTPTPSTYATLMYATGKDPATGKHISVERNTSGKEMQKRILLPQQEKQKIEGNASKKRYRPKRRGR